MYINLTAIDLLLHGVLKTAGKHIGSEFGDGSSGVESKLRIWQLAVTKAVVCLSGGQHFITNLRYSKWSFIYKMIHRIDR